MTLIRSLIAFSCIYNSAKCQDLNVAYSLVKSALNYFKSSSVVFVLDDQHWGNRGTVNFVKLQILLSSNDFYFSSLSTPITAAEALRSRFQNRKEAVVVLHADKMLIQFLEKLSNETDISSHKWLLTSTKTSKSVEKLKIPPTSEFIFAEGSDSTGYNLSEIYNIQPDKKLRRALGHWVIGETLLLTSPEDMFRRRRNLHRATVKILSFKKDPCVDTSFVVGIASVVQCIHKRIWDTSAEMLNATSEIILVPNLDLNAIQSTVADLTFRSAPLNSFDMNTRSYVWPLFSTRLEMVTSYLPQKVEWRTFILPFSGEMWMVILLWTILCDFVLATVGFFNEWKTNEDTFWQYYCKVSFTTSFIFCNQGVSTFSKFISYRILLLMTFIVPGVLSPGYTASLTSFLTVSLNRMPFRNLQELSQTPEYKIGWHYSFPLENMFNLEDNSPLNEALLRNNVVPRENMPVKDIDAVERMCSEKFTFLTPWETILALKPKCKFYKLKEHFKTVFTSMEMRKSSWYHYFLDRCVRNIEFTGVGTRIKIHAIMKYIKVYERQILDSSTKSPIMLNNIALPFVILLLGVLSSGFLLALEIVWFAQKPSRKSRELEALGQRCVRPAIETGNVKAVTLRKRE